MKIFIPNQQWRGGTASFLASSLRKFGHEVLEYSPSDFESKRQIFNKLKLTQIKKVDNYILNLISEKYNSAILEEVKSYKPDLFLMINEVGLRPETVEEIRKMCNPIMVCWVADNPFDSFRYKYFPMNLKYFDYLFLGDMIWYQNVMNVAPKARISQLIGAFEPDITDSISISDDERAQLTNRLSFVGTAYGTKVEGVYRVSILDQVSDLGLRIWGDGDWNLRFKYYPNLKDKYNGRVEELEDLYKIYKLSKINLNIPNPQVFTSFQSRVFEIASVKGFQIIDHRSDLEKYFSPSSYVSFKSISDLRDKIKFFIENPSDRERYVNEMYKEIIAKHSYHHRVKEMLNIMNL
jgi:spore maturation protein CgeB